MGGLFDNGAFGKILNPIGAIAPKSGIGQALDPAGAIGRKVGGTAGGIIDPASLFTNDTKETPPPKPKAGTSLLTEVEAK
tara:strand:+ start:368 stop:607 length:240 start_codon:yes stop_codon:yes gene_type:complete